MNAARSSNVFPGPRPAMRAGSRPAGAARRRGWVLAAALALAAPGRGPAQGAAPASTGSAPAVAGANLLPAKVCGEQTERLVNLWDGVNGEQTLRVNTALSPVLDDVGRMRNTPMSPTVCFADMNDDKLKDLVVSDTYGFLWLYLNAGQPGQPAFTNGAFMPTFLGWNAKIHVCDWDGDGDQDVVVGTFYGDVAVLENLGTRQEARFTRRMGVPRYVDPQFGIEDPKDRLPTLNLGKQTLLLGNYMAPWVTDWNRDGKPDLILGEGTYSANSVRLLINTGSRNKPVFIEDRVFYLAYGEGYEQLTPAVVDYNGDGIDDLLVGTRTGQVRMHKGTKEAIEGKDMVAAVQGSLAPAVLECEGVLKLGGKDVYDQMSSVHPCDWNADGLFDLLLGTSQGRIMVALNQGTKAAPSFPKVEPVKGVDAEVDRLQPVAWFNGMNERVFWGNFIGGMGNAAVLFSAEKEVLLRAGAEPIVPVAGSYFFYFRYAGKYAGWTHNRLTAILPVTRGATTDPVTGARVLSPQATVPMKLKQQYEFSLSTIVIGKPVTWAFRGYERLTAASETVADTFKDQVVSGTIPPSVTWQPRTFRFRCPSEVQSNLNYYLYFRMPEGDVQFLFDNLVVTEVGR